MTKQDAKQKKQDLGIFYTPSAVASFIFEILTIWKEREDKEAMRWQSHKPKAHFPSVIDPAVGEGVFLKAAVEQGFTEPDWIFGLDIDENAVRKWKEINLLKQFGGKEKDLDAHFFHQNGLESIKWEQHTGTYRYKLRTDDIKNQQFDTVVGNPPYGGVGVDFDGKLSQETRVLLEALSKYEIIVAKNQKTITTQGSRATIYLPMPYHVTAPQLPLVDIANKAEGIQIEILFVERFLQLAKPGGWVAIIIPDGILTNSNAHYVREFIAEKAKVKAIVSLPRGAFKHAGTNAKTSILFLRKCKEDKSSECDYPVFLASAEEISGNSFSKIVEEYKKFYNVINKPMNKSSQIQIIKDTNNKEAVMVRTDKTLKEMMEEKPASRWDVGYWHPMYEEVLSEISTKYRVEALGSLLDDPIIAPDHVRASKGEKIGEEYDTEYRTLKDLLFTGLNYAHINYCSDNACQRLKRSQLKLNDVLFAGSGVGAIGRVGIVERISRKSCVGDLFIIRNTKLNQYYLYTYLLTRFGQLQIEKVFHGIQSAKINTKEIETIVMPMLPEKTQNHIESEYKKMSAFHDKAMRAKKKGDEAGYKKNIETAGAMLRDLIARTEAVIRGKMEDVI